MTVTRKGRDRQSKDDTALPRNENEDAEMQGNHQQPVRLSQIQTTHTAEVILNDDIGRILASIHKNEHPPPKREI
jgi:hypothetical protein